MTVMILSKTTSSPDESLASNLQCDTVLLNSVNATSKDKEFEDMRLQTKKECREERAADVIGPVDKDERMISKKGAKRVGSGKLSMSTHSSVAVNVEGTMKVDVSHTIDFPNYPFELLKTSHEISFSSSSSGGLRVECWTRSSQAKISSKCRISRVQCVI